METYSKDQILVYLKEQKDIASAISNIYALGKNLPYIWCEDSQSVLFYFDKEETNTKSEIITKLYDYMLDNGWEYAEYCNYISYEEVMGYFNLKVKIGDEQFFI